MGPGNGLVTKGNPPRPWELTSARLRPAHSSRSSPPSQPDMLERLMPRDEQFFDLFNQLAGHLAASAKLLNDLFREPHRAPDHVKAIKDEEHKADLLTAAIILRINKSFVTPFDREDIHNVAS